MLYLLAMNGEMAFLVVVPRRHLNAYIALQPAQIMQETV
jgi:hypothetical protein